MINKKLFYKANKKYLKSIRDILNHKESFSSPI